ncbi:Sulfate permease [plant metagenome]|uniref:Sulfate permease n=1 Tax=plant metagenome TaxID=1297885 RepID=A0A484V826_9ZZZZ
MRIDVSRAHFWDVTAIHALDRVVFKFRRAGAQVEVAGMNAASATMVDCYGTHDKAHAGDLSGH